jgi:hypothetical protein
MLAGAADPSEQPSNAATSAGPVMSGWVDAVVLALVSLAIGALRIWNHVPFWRDEVATGIIVDRPLGSLIYVVATQEAGMGPYYSALWGWTRLSTSDEWIRMFSALGTAVSVVLLHRLANRWHGRSIAGVVALVYLLNPFVLEHQTDARAYSWVTACGIAIVLAALRLRRTRSVGSGVVLGVLVGVALAMHIIFFLTIVAFGMAWWWCETDRRWVLDRRLRVVPLAGLVVFLPFSWSLLTRSEQVNWIPDISVHEVSINLQALFGGSRSVLVLGVGWLLVVVALVRDRRWKDHRLVFPLATTFLPILALIAVSLVLWPFFVSRYMLTALPWAVLAAIVGYATIRWRGVPVAAFAVALLSVAVFLVRGPITDIDRPDNAKAATEHLISVVEPGDVVLFYPRAARIMLRWYGGDQLPGDIANPGNDPDVLFPKDFVDDAIVAAARDAQRLWIVGIPSDLPEGGELSTLVADNVSARPVLDTTEVGGFTFELLGPLPTE